MENLKTMKIHGKDYVTVNERLIYFRTAEEFKGWSLLSEIIHRDEKSIIIKATIKDSNDRIIANGMAEEVKGSSNINKTSYVENCETSAWGRCLANINIGIVGGVASADEVLNAQNKQSNVKTKKVLIIGNSFNDKDELKKVGARWDGKIWSFDIEESKVEEKIKALKEQFKKLDFKVEGETVKVEPKKELPFNKEDGEAVVVAHDTAEARIIVDKLEEVGFLFNRELNKFYILVDNQMKKQVCDELEKEFNIAFVAVA